MAKTGAAQTDYRRKRPSRVRGGNRQTNGRLFAGSGGADRPRLNTTLPVEALEQLDALALAHNLQRNEVLTLALATIADPQRGLAEAREHFNALAGAWEGFGVAQQVQASEAQEPGAVVEQEQEQEQLVRPRPRSTRTGRKRKLSTLARARIRYLVALGSDAPRGWMSALAQELGCSTNAISKVAMEMREAQRPAPEVFQEPVTFPGY